MEAKKKVVRKKANTDDLSNKTLSSHSFSAYVDPTLNMEKLRDVLRQSMQTPYDLDVKPRSWVMPNRAKFGRWLDKTFQYNGVAAPTKKQACDVDQEETLSLFPHQRFIKDYMQFDSPYRGLLLYHGLGVGKTLASIAAAEMLLNHMDVVVMVPASLRDNYVNEVRKSGRNFFQIQQHWSFVPLHIFEDHLAEVTRVLRIPSKEVHKQKGLWVPLPGKPANFTSLPGAVQSAIQQQIDHIIRNRFEYINYNGLNRKKIEELAANGNPFDHKCIIIDEIHNLVSRIANQRLIGKAIYKLLMSAQQCKLIMLSGTPIINYPHEVAYLINLITGPRTIYEIKAAKETMWTSEEVRSALEENPYLDYYRLDTNGKKVRFALLPRPFVMQDRHSSLVLRSKTSYPLETELTEQILHSMRSKGMAVHHTISSHVTETLPTKDKEFNKYFVNFDKNEVENSLLFMRRILGTVSYYSTYNPELYPSVDITEVPLTMNDEMFKVYDTKRAEERRKEKNAVKKRKQATDGNIFQSGGQVYRFYSRAICNFVFPKGVVRPFPSQLSEMKKEIDEEEDVLEEWKEVQQGEGVKDYPTLVEEALKRLEDGEYLRNDVDLQRYSPKMHAIVQSIQTSPGNVLVYSQFRKVEGLGILAMALRQRGFVPFRIKKVGTTWDIDMPEEDYAKPKYVMFTGSDEETRVLLKVFNSDLKNIPEPIRTKLHLLGGANNFHGEIIRVMMITQSGAEGISLKNVRQVHVMEPYWNHIRIDQVIGRAVRTCSHIDLKPSERHVDVFIYYMKFSKEQLDNTVTLIRQDKGMTSDEYIHHLAKTKAKIIAGFLELMKRASVDCALHAKHHGNLRCFAFPTNLPGEEVTFEANLAEEPLDDQYKRKLSQLQWEGSVWITKKGNFIIRKDTQEVYDYDVYVESGKLVRLGILTVQDNKKVIRRI